MPNKLSQFWQELKRRKVIRTITVYAAVAFVILELLSIIIEPLQLPEWTLQFAIVFLIIGFIIAIVLSWIYDIHPEGGIVKTEPAHKVKSDETPIASNSWKIASYISFLVIVGLIVLNIFGGKTRVRIDESLAKSVAVLPFHNLSGDDEQEYICVGLTEEIISHLYKIKSFDEVRSFTSVMNYRDSKRNIPLIAEELGVNYILEGSYKRIGAQMRVTAQLIESKSDKHIWLKDYDLPYDEIIGIPADIALQIAYHLKAFIANDEQQQIERMQTNNLEAYEIMQHALYLFNENFVANSEKIIQLAQEAIGLDPGYADAYGMMGLQKLMQGGYFGEVEMKTIVWEATDNLNTALELDQSNEWAFLGLAAINHFLQWDYINAENMYLKALDSNRGLLVLNGWYSLFLIEMSRFDDALNHINISGWSLEEYKAKIHFLSGAYQKAKDIINEMKMSEANSTGLAPIVELCVWIGDYKSAIAIGESAIQSNNLEIVIPRFQANLAVAYFKTGALEPSGIITDKLIQKSDTSSVGYPEYFLGYYYSWIGENDSAIYWLQKAVVTRNIEMPWLKADPAFNSLKDDPRYWDLYERTGHKAYDEYIASKQQ